MAVAIKKKGFKNISLYNGGLKDWKKSDMTLESTDPLPNIDIDYINAIDLYKKITESDSRGCVDASGNPLLTLIDFRSSLKLSMYKGADNYRIKTDCKTIVAFLDDFLDNTELINKIPQKGPVVSISETGNRDLFLIRFLSKFGFSNISGLQFGMRAWIKADYPVEKITDMTPKQQVNEL